MRSLLKKYRAQLPADFNLETDLQVLTPVDSLRSYLAPWTAFKLLPVGKECLEEMVLSACETLRDDNVCYAELRNSPFNIPILNNISLTESLEWLVSAFQNGSSKTGVDCKLIVSITRHECLAHHPNALLDAIANVNSPDTVVGMDVSGDEAIMLDSSVAQIFRRAKDDLGLGITIHAGETGIVENVDWAINQCNADRIGHGLAMAQSPKLLAETVRRDICVETCLTSNLRSGQVTRIEDHPVHKFLDACVPFVLCSDNPQVHGKLLSDEYSDFLSAFKRSDVIDNMLNTQVKYAFRRK